MRVLQINSARTFGGGERHLADLARGLQGRGHEVLAALRESSPLREPLSFLPAQNVYAVRLRNALDIGGARKLARIARERKVDLIHAHVARDYAPAAFAARFAPGTRLVITRHVLFPMSNTHRLTLSNVSRVIAVSEPVARALRSQSIFDEARIRVIENGVDLARFERARAEAEAETPGRPFRVGIVGELSVVKGQEEFVRAAALIRNDFGGRVEFLIAGEDNRGGEYRARVERLVSELNLANNVRLLGRVEDAWGLFVKLDVLVSASHSEAFGLAMAEALACGVPIVATATGGARSLIEDGVNGLLVPRGDVRAIAAAVASLLSDDELRRALGAQARRVAGERFDPERMVEATERVYEEALGLSNTGQYHPR
ncbi:MAG TPA: glycosyltransferase family 4 protein [Pyrinomonadaceae bacterium]|jgi:glycosyltransferase involved in cell wall biosynthesis